MAIYKNSRYSTQNNFFCEPIHNLQFRRYYDDCLGRWGFSLNLQFDFKE